MVSFGAEKYKNGIKKLWVEAFGDEESYIDNFFKHMYKDENVVVFTENDEVLGMAFILPVFSKGINGRYVYAVATAKKSRGKGICRQVMSFIDENARKNGEGFLILVPASKSLFEFYEKMGYNHLVFKPERKEICNLGDKISVKEYYEIRKDNFSEYDLIEWDEKSLEYILSQGEIRKMNYGAVFLSEGKVIEALDRNLEFKEPFALIKYMADFKFERPYFNLAMN